MYHLFKRSPSVLLRCCLATLILLTLPAWSAPNQDIPWPTVRIPKIAKAPVIDGHIGAEEWADAAAITGFHPVFLDEIRSQWYVAYDDDWLYIAMHSPHYPGTWPAAKGKPNLAGDSDLGWDAHVEINLSPNPREQAQQKGFFIIHINPRDAVMDQHYNWMPGQEGREWQCERKVKSVANDRYWDLEAAFKRTSMTDKPFDNTEWVLHLVRADGFAGQYFFAWKYSWYVNCHEFPAAFFDPRTPVFRFLNLGEVRKGDLDVDLEVKGNGPARPIEVSVRALDAQKKAVYEKTETITVADGERKQLRFQGKLVYPEKGALNLEIRAYMKDQDGRSVTLYEQKIPSLIPWTVADDEARKDEIARRKNLITSFQYNFAYLPSVGLGKAMIDNDIFGMPEKIAAARDFRVKIVNIKDTKTPLATADGKIDGKTLMGETAMKMPDLPDGEYASIADLLGADGKVIDTQEIHFARKHYPWEGNKLGKERVVIPPFTPLIVQGNYIKPWGRTYEVDSTGLFRTIVHTGDNLLRAPMRLEAEEAGKAVTLQGRNLRVQHADNAGHTVVVDADGAVGSVDCTVHGEMEYDGWYLVTLTLAPRQPATLGKLDLVIPFTTLADSVLARRSPMMTKGAFMGDFPTGEGVVWDSRELGSDPYWGTFVPQCLVGNGDKGLVWEAESFDGWQMKLDQPCLQLEREGGQPTLRVRFFHEPVLLDKPRTIRLAVWTEPAKPMASNWRALAWGFPNRRVAWEANSGYRFYGDGVDSFTLPGDEDFLLLRKALVDGTIYGMASLREIREGLPLILYGSNMGAGMAMKELETYSGEWLGGAWPESPTPENTKGMWNWGKSVQFNEPRQLAAAFVNVCPSYQDCYLWYHQKYVRLTGLQGTFWDNNNLNVFWSPDPATGKPVYRWDVWSRREFVKRLATMCRQEGKEPFWVENTGGLQLSFNTIILHCEGDFYLPKEITWYEYLPMDKVRVYLTSRRGLIPWLWVQGGGSQDPARQEQIRRSEGAMRLLHDIGMDQYGHEPYAGLEARLDDAVDFFGDANDIEFIGYWRSQPYYRFIPGKPGGKPLLISLYRNTRLNRCLAVVANPNPDPVDGLLFFNARLLLGKDLPATLTDIESGRQFAFGAYAGENGWWYDTWRWNGTTYETKAMTFPGYDHRLLVLK